MSWNTPAVDVTFLKYDLSFLIAVRQINVFFNSETKTGYVKHAIETKLQK